MRIHHSHRPLAHLCMLALCLLALPLLCSALAAQNTAQSGFSCQLRTIGWGDMPEQLYVSTSNGYEPVAIGNSRFSPPYNYRGPRVLRFYTQIPGPQTTPPAPVASVELPANAGPMLLVFLPEADGSLRLVALPASSQQASDGMITFVNVTSAPLTLTFGEAKLQLSPMEMKTGPLPAPTPPNRPRLKVPMQVYWKNQASWELLSSAYLSPRAKSRPFVFLHQPATSHDGNSQYAQDPIQWTMVYGS